MGIKFHKGGLYTTVQDYGRVGYQDVGISVCGAMDKKSLAIGNMLVDNLEDEAGLEIAFIGPEIEFTKDNFIAITGGDLNSKINNKEIPMYKAILVKKGDILTFGNNKSGTRSYITFAGGLDIEKVMGSKSTNVKCSLGGYKGRNLKSGDFIKFTNPTDYLPNYLSRQVEIEEKNENILRVILGPQEDAFTIKGIDTFFKETYEITKDFDRMGCRLEGPCIEHKTSADIISDGIALGSIQVPSHGKPIIMLTDRQTTGGYTKIGTVITVDIGKLANLKPKDKIRFKEVSIEEAQKLLKEYKEELSKIKEKVNKPCIEVL